MKGKRKRHWALIILAILLAAYAGVYYINFVEKKIYEESTSHLHEIYGQINKDFQFLAEQNWTLLMDWDVYIKHLTKCHEEEQLNRFFLLGKAERNYADFYFLNQNGEYRSIAGSEGYLQMDPEVKLLMTEHKNIVTDGTMPDDEELTFFAVPVESGEYEGFSYCALAISYHNHHLEELLDVSAFSGQIECYLVYRDGRVLFSTGTEGKNPKNFWNMLKENAVFRNTDWETVSRDIEEKRTGTVKYRLEHQEYYLTYMPVAFQDWMLLGNAPGNVVNASMNLIQRTTIAITVGIVLLISLSILLYSEGIHEKKLKNMSMEIQYREQLFTMLVEHTPEIYAMFSTDTYQVEYISPNVERLLGIPAEDIRADITALSRSHVGDIGLHWEDLSNLRPGECLQAERERNQVSTGERRWYREKLYRIRLEGEEEEKFVMVMSDYTEDKRLRSQLEDALQIAKAANRAKSNFLSNMSHDIRTPMNAILGFSSLLAKQVDDPEKVRMYTQKISDSGQYLLGLINDILDMSKIESGNTTLNISPFSLTELLEEIQTIIQPLAKAKRQTFTISVNDIREEEYLGDVLKIKQILLNLLSNAVKYTQQGGCIKFTISLAEWDQKGNARLRFQVEDNGIGMSPEYLEIIFEPFTRENSEKKGEMHGTGLGMAIAKNLVDLLGGTINVTSEKGKGSCFVVEIMFAVASDKPSNLPDFQETIAKDWEEKPEPNEEKATGQSLAGVRFLAAEDNAFNAEILKEFLEAEGAQCDIAENGLEAFNMFEASEPGYYQMILLDEQMPVMFGTEAAAAIRKSAHPQAGTIKIIAMTANAFSEDVERSMASGMDAHLSKPIDMDILKETVLKLLEF